MRTMRPWPLPSPTRASERICPACRCMPSLERDAPALILTRRAATLRKHAGQWAFPGWTARPRRNRGGNRAQGDARGGQRRRSVQDQVLGRLDDFVTRSGFVMTPVVVWGGARARNRAESGRGGLGAPDTNLTEFLREDAPMLSSLSGSEHPVLRMPVGSDYIAAPTAALIYQFREVCLLGRETRESRTTNNPPLRGDSHAKDLCTGGSQAKDLCTGGSSCPHR